MNNFCQSMILGLMTSTTTSVFAQASAPAEAEQTSTFKIYGRVNLSVERQTNAGLSKSVLQDNSSRIGFKGQESLGGGANVGFILEHGLNADTGSQARPTFWGRQSELYLGHKDYGKLRFGVYGSEAYYATADYVGMHNHDTGTSADALYAYTDYSREGNKIGYQSPSLGGVVVHASTSLHEQSGAVNSYANDLAANYVHGSWHLGLGGRKVGDAKQVAARVLYMTGPYALGGYVQRDSNGMGAGLGSRTTARLAGMYVLDAMEFHLSVGYAGDYSNVDKSKANQATIGVNYNLSKRSKVYGFVTRIAAGDNTTYVSDSKAIALGIRHNF